MTREEIKAELRKLSQEIHWDSMSNDYHYSTKRYAAQRAREIELIFQLNTLDDQKGASHG